RLHFSLDCPDPVLRFRVHESLIVVTSLVFFLFNSLILSSFFVLCWPSFFLVYFSLGMIARGVMRGGSLQKINDRPRERAKFFTLTERATAGIIPANFGASSSSIIISNLGAHLTPGLLTCKRRSLLLPPSVVERRRSF
ncbi:MAG: hypothetical protein WCF22_03175, partial [Candidatus Sulfotelmatobacter sp.]